MDVDEQVREKRITGSGIITNDFGIDGFDGVFGGEGEVFVEYPVSDVGVHGQWRVEGVVGEGDGVGVGFCEDAVLGVADAGDEGVDVAFGEALEVGAVG